MNTVISYPLYAPEPTWLKVAALCWDRIYTVRADSEQQPPEELAELDRELGGVLGALDISEVSTDPTVLAEFDRWLRKNGPNFTTPVALMESEFILLHGLFRDIEAWEDFTALLTRHGLYRKGEEQVSKIPSFEFMPRLLAAESTWSTAPYDAFNRQEYFEAVAAGDYRWAALVRKRGLRDQTRLIDFEANYAKQVVFMPPQIPMHYVALCAAKLAANLNTDLVGTAKSYVDTAMVSERDLGADIATSTIKALLPADVDALPLQTLAELRSEFAIQRLKYAADVQALAAEVGRISSKGTLYQVRRTAKQIALERYHSTESIYRKTRVEAVAKTLALTVAAPAVASSIASLLNSGLFVPAAVTGTLAIFAAQRLADAAEAAEKRNSRGWSYLLALRRRLKPWWKFW